VTDFHGDQAKKNPKKIQKKSKKNSKMAEILMITLVYSKRVSVRNNLLHSERGIIGTVYLNYVPE
jgi:hypothetical protein